jgi:flagellar protein FlaG
VANVHQANAMSVPAPAIAQAVPREDSAKARSPEKVIEEEAARLEINQKTLKAKESKAPLTVEEAAKAFQEFLKNLPSDLQFRPDQETGQIIFKVVNPLTREVIRQYPPEEMLEMARRLRSTGQNEGAGLLLDGQL